MAANTSLLPFRSPVESDSEPEVVPLGDADAVLDALASETARSILATLYEEPGTASEVAGRVDTSLQNVGYHLDRLVDVGVVGVADTWYSEKGVEMDVYAPTSDPLVLFAGPNAEEDAVREVVEEPEAPTVTGA